MLASTDDINAHLPTDKLNAADPSGSTVGDAVARLQTDTERTIKGYLSGTFTPVILAGWADPDSTPEFIRGIAGRLVASGVYAVRLSHDTDDTKDRTYPQRKYNEAMQMLKDIVEGQVTLPEVPEGSNETQFGESFFLPNSTSTEPKFTMDAKF